MRVQETARLARLRVACRQASQTFRRDQRQQRQPASSGQEATPRYSPSHARQRTAASAFDVRYTGPLTPRSSNRRRAGTNW